mgnify:CR=1 FL=1
MPRISRMLNKGEKTVYHVISRTVLDGFPFGDVEKEEMVKITKRFAKLKCILLKLLDFVF